MCLASNGTRTSTHTHPCTHLRRGKTHLKCEKIAYVTLSDKGPKVTSDNNNNNNNKSRRQVKKAQAKPTKQAKQLKKWLFAKGERGEQK